MIDGYKAKTPMLKFKWNLGCLHPNPQRICDGKVTFAIVRETNKYISNFLRFSNVYG